MRILVNDSERYTISDWLNQLIKSGDKISKLFADKGMSELILCWRSPILQWGQGFI